MLINLFIIDYLHSKNSELTKAIFPFTDFYPLSNNQSHVLGINLFKRYSWIKNIGDCPLGITVTFLKSSLFMIGTFSGFLKSLNAFVRLKMFINFELLEQERQVFESFRFDEILALVKIIKICESVSQAFWSQTLIHWMSIEVHSVVWFSGIKTPPISSAWGVLYFLFTKLKNWISLTYKILTYPWYVIIFCIKFNTHKCLNVPNYLL